MTAMNVFVQGDTAYLLTDTAVWDHEGTVTEFRFKFVQASTRLGPQFAIAVTGVLCPVSLAERLERLRPARNRDILEALPSILRELEADWCERAAGTIHYVDGPSAGRSCVMGMAVAMYDDDTGLASAYVLENGVGEVFPAPYQAWQVMKVLNHTPDLHHLSVRRGRLLDLSDPRSFDPDSDGLGLLQVQREQEARTVHGTFYNVGGYAVLTKVSEGGVQSKLLGQWPDPTGQRIDPSRALLPLAA